MARTSSSNPLATVMLAAAAVLAATLAAAAPVEVTVRRDAWGVPHVASSSDLGAFYGLGWVHAADRLLQMNLVVWTVQGRMAEAAGPDWIEQDRYWRTVGMWRHAQRVADALDAEHRALLEAFSAGVNDWLAAHPAGPGPAFAALGMTPEAWTPAHCLAAWWRVANLFIADPFKKAGPYYEFTDRVAEVGVEQAVAEFLAGRHPGDPPAGVVQAWDVPQDVQDAIADYAESVGYGDSKRGWASLHPDVYDHTTPSFSHAWVVGGGLTSSGLPVLISDPQITVTLPNLFYEWHASGATFNARGIGSPGAAGLLIGFNGHVAWGLTAAGADQRDLMRLEAVGRDRYVVDGEELEFASGTETILVAGGEPETVTWRESIWGPVVTSLVDGVRGRDQFALKGLPYCEGDRDTFSAMVGMLRARDMTELRTALDDWRFPSANLVAADADGRVFFTVLGGLPVRSASSPLAGLIAQEGTSLEFDWQGTIPGEYKPWVLDPQAGYVLSANHRAAGDWYPIKLGMGFMTTGDTVRSYRLRELLESLSSPLAPAEIVAATHLDCVNAAKRDMVGVLRHARDLGAALSAEAASALDHLAAWSEAGGEVLTSSDGVFLASKIPTDFRVLQTGEAMQQLYGGGQGGLSLFLKTMTAEIAADPGFLPDADALAYLDTALAKAWTDAKAASGDPAEWDAMYAAGWAATPALDWMASPYALGPGHSGGASFTPPTLACADGATIWSQRSQSYTQVVDLAAPDASLSLMPPGNTEGPDDLYWTATGVDWAAGSLHPAPLSAPAVEQISTLEATLVYQPPPPCPPPCFRHAGARLGP